MTSEPITDIKKVYDDNKEKINTGLLNFAKSLGDKLSDPNRTEDIQALIISDIFEQASEISFRELLDNEQTKQLLSDYVISDVVKFYKERCTGAIWESLEDAIKSKFEGNKSEFEIILNSLHLSHLRKEMTEKKSCCC